MWLAVALLVLFAHPAAAQPADCTPAPPTGPVMPLAIADTACHDDPPKPPQDVLRGEPGDVLGGPPSSDLLRGPGDPPAATGVR
jgi:hypothetical protein